jgi:predicted glycoside hydrolase/deacetylase ChbG (UPF0249 family)
MTSRPGGDGRTRLVVRADDFGMCHAVNQGVRAAWEEGIVTVATTMAPCPWYEEAAAIIRETGMPTGAHQTLTCEWDFFRWRPLTDGASLTGPDATFWRTSEEAEEHADHDEVVVELLAQVDRLRTSGAPLEFLDCHMRTAVPAAYAEVSERSGAPFLYSGAVPLDTLAELTPRDAKEKKAWLLGWLGDLQPGLHMLVCHPAVPSPELEALTSPRSEPWPWAATWRVPDLDVLTDAEVRGAVERAGITLCSLSDALSPVGGPDQAAA